MARSDTNEARLVLRQIEEAFAQRAYPGDAHLVKGVGDEEEEILRDMAGKHWRDLSAKFLRLHQDALFFLSPEGFRFFLPGYLIASIVDPAEADVIPGCLFVVLFPPREDQADNAGLLQKGWEDRVNGLTEEERQAIRSWLEYEMDDYDRTLVSDEGIRFWGLTEEREG